MFRQAGFLEIDEHPTARFLLERIVGATSLPPGEWVRVKLRGKMSMKGNMRPKVADAQVRWTPASEGQPERIHVRVTLHITYREFDIMMPRGSTRAFAGTGARIEAHLVYAPDTAQRAPAGGR